MKIFLQHRQNLLYLAGTDAWAKSSSEALDFPNYDIAVAFASQHDVTDVQIVLKFPDSPFNIVLPFRKELACASVQV
jgi:hypothetical protein